MKAHLTYRLPVSLKHYQYLLELLFWVTGVGVVALMEPDGKHLFSFCPASWLFEDGCWGCGLGHGVAYLFRGELMASWEAHPLALPAVVILLWRCAQLLRWHLNHFDKPTRDNNG